MIEGDKVGLVDAYKAAHPTVENSQAIVRSLSAEHNISESKCRAALVSAGVYIAQPKRKTSLDPQEKAQLAKEADSAALTPGNRYQFVADKSKDLNTTQQIVEEALREKGRYPLDEHENEIRERQARELEKRAQKDLEREERFRKSLQRSLMNTSQFSFQERLDGHGGWFDNPLWILNTVVIILLISLVVAGIGSIFSP